MSEGLFIWKTDNGSVAEFELGLNLSQKSSATSLLILACHDNEFTEEEINPLILKCNLHVFGGIYPKLVFKNKLMQQGCIIIGFHQAVDVSIISDVSTLKTDAQLEQAIDATQVNRGQLTRNDNFLIFYDGLINNIEPFIDTLFEYLDHKVNIIGGGAGNLEFKQKPCVFTNQGLLVDVIQLVSLTSQIITGTGHGWNILQGPFLVSESEKQTINSLNYSPAFSIYKEAIENEGHYTFNDHNFFDIAKHFPLGIADLNNQLVVRDPILTHDGSIQCVGDIPVNSMVYLLKGSTSSLLASAEQAAKSATTKIDGKDFTATMVFDCISRMLYMENSFSQELELITNQCSKQIFFGVLSLGEIANNESGALKLLNKSTVIGSW